MSGQFSMFNPPNLLDTPNATSSPESAGGPTPCDSQDGPMTDLFGREVAPVRDTAQPVKVKARLTHGTFGRLGFHSSASAALMSSLANKCRQRLGMDGSTLFRQKWKERRTPSGRLYWEHTASVPRTGDNDSGSWPTPNAVTGGANSQRESRGAGGPDLQEVALMATWPTPGCPAPHDSENTEGRLRIRKAGNFQDDARIYPAAWASPSSTDMKGAPAKPYSERGGGAKGQRLDSQVVHLGPVLTGSPVEIRGLGQLNPAHSRWLMGYPQEWDDCAVTAMRLSQRLPRKSSKRTGRS